MTTTFDIAAYMQTPEYLAAAGTMDPKDYFAQEMGKLTPQQTTDLLGSVNMAPATFTSQMNKMYNLGLPDDIISNIATYNKWTSGLPPDPVVQPDPGVPPTSPVVPPDPGVPPNPQPPVNPPPDPNILDFKGSGYGMYLLKDAVNFPGVKQFMNEAGGMLPYYVKGGIIFDNPEGIGEPWGVLKYDANGIATLTIVGDNTFPGGEKELKTGPLQSDVDPKFFDAIPTSISQSESGVDVNKAKELKDLLVSMGFDITKFPKAEQSAYSGLDPGLSAQLQNMVYPQLEKSLTDYSGQIDTEMKNAVDMYNYQLGRALKEQIPAAVNKLNTRGILHGTEAQTILTNIAKEAAIDSATKGYEAAIMAANKKLAMPAMLNTILSETKYAESSGTQTDESKPFDIMTDILGKAQYSKSTSTSTDASVPYQILANIATA